jgi:1-acyl-sn-glycerol-3-phosphate acyltransferase
VHADRPAAPTPGAGRVARFLGHAYLRAFRWRVEGTLPPDTKGVAIAAPHTSNWDLPFMLAVSYVLGVKPAWLGKRELFRGPLGWLLRRLGGVPVDRAKRGDIVAQAVRHFGVVDRLFLVIPPSGTRKRATHWKSGFYHVARGAGVPIICAFLDYRRRVGGIGPIIMPTDDVAADMDTIRAFYDGVTGKHPELTTTVRLLEEEPARPRRRA